jgi:hypothetical protein
MPSLIIILIHIEHDVRRKVKNAYDFLTFRKEYAKSNGIIGVITLHFPIMLNLRYFSTIPYIQDTK